MNSKFIKFLIILNGIMLPLLVGFGFYRIIVEFFPDKNNFPDGIILGKEFEDAKKDSLALQGLKYYSPVDLYNSKNKYRLTGLVL